MGFGIGTEYNGEVKLVEQLVVGDRLMGDDFTPRTVQHPIVSAVGMLYKITPTSGHRQSFGTGDPRYAGNQSPSFIS